MEERKVVPRQPRRYSLTPHAHDLLVNGLEEAYRTYRENYDQASISPPARFTKAWKVERLGIAGQTLDNILNGPGAAKSALAAAFSALGLPWSEEYCLRAKDPAEPPADPRYTPLARPAPLPKRRRRLRLVSSLAAILLLAVLAGGWRYYVSWRTSPQYYVSALRALRGTPSAATELCKEMAEEAHKAWYGPNEAKWVAAFDEAYPDIEGCLEWMQRHRPPDTLCLAGALTRYWRLRNVLLAKEKWLAAAADESAAPNKVDPLVRARALLGLSLAKVKRYDAVPDRRQVELAWAYAHRAQSLAHGLRDQESLEASAWNLIAVCEHALGARRNDMDRMRAAERAFGKALRLTSQAGDTQGEALTHLTHAMFGIGPDGPARYAEMAWEAKTALAFFRSPNGSRYCEEEASTYLRDAGYGLRPEDVEEVGAVDQECRLQIRRHLTRADDDSCLKAWKQLGGLALSTGNTRLQKECLLGLYNARGEAFRVDAAVRLLAACRANCTGERGFDFLPKDCSQYRASLPIDQQGLADRWMEEGRTAGLQKSLSNAILPFTAVIRVASR